MKADIHAHPDILLLVERATDIVRAKPSGQLGIILGFQGLEFFDDDLSLIDRFADEGVLVMQLTYNQESNLGNGYLSNAAHLGLPPLGAEAVVRINARQVLLDLAHSAPPTALDAARLTTKPVVVSHSGCSGVFEHPRNQPDDVLRAVATSGGVFGIYLMPFLGQDPVGASRKRYCSSHACTKHLRRGSRRNRQRQFDYAGTLLRRRLPGGTYQDGSRARAVRHCHTSRGCRPLGCRRAEYAATVGNPRLGPLESGLHGSRCREGDWCEFSASIQ